MNSTPEPNPWRAQAIELETALDKTEREVEQLRRQLIEAEAHAAQWEQPGLVGDVVNLTEWKE